MAKITISMPDVMSEYVSARVSEGQYGNVSEYFRDLVRREQERASAVTELRRLLQEGEASGTSERSPAEIWQAVKARYQERNAKS